MLSRIVRWAVAHVKPVCGCCKTYRILLLDGICRDLCFPKSGEFTNKRWDFANLYNHQTYQKKSEHVWTCYISDHVGYVAWSPERRKPQKDLFTEKMMIHRWYIVSLGYKMWAMNKKKQPFDKLWWRSRAHTRLPCKGRLLTIKQKTMMRAMWKDLWQKILCFTDGEAVVGCKERVGFWETAISGWKSRVRHEFAKRQRTADGSSSRWNPFVSSRCLPKLSSYLWCSLSNRMNLVSPVRDLSCYRSAHLSPMLIYMWPCFKTSSPFLCRQRKPIDIWI